MRIISQTNSKIIISYPKETFQDYILMIKVFMLTGIFTCVPTLIALMPLSEIGVLRISCDRVEPKQVDCQISKSKYLDFVKQEPINYKFVNSVRYVTVDEGVDSDGDSVYSYRFSFVTKSGEKVPFENISSSTANSAVSSLNPFLNSKQEYFSYAIDERFDINLYFNSLILLPFIALGLIPFIFITVGIALTLLKKIVLLIDYQEIILDKSEHQLNHVERKLLRTKVNSFLFNEIAKVDVLYSSNSKGVVSFTPRININSKVQFKLDTVSDRQVAIKIANDLNRFMGLPEEEDPVVKE
jgi:hypothetical protein